MERNSAWPIHLARRAAAGYRFGRVRRTSSIGGPLRADDNLLRTAPSQWDRKAHHDAWLHAAALLRGNHTARQHCDAYMRAAGGTCAFAANGG